MTTKQYLAALAKLGLTPSGKQTAEAIGLTLRQAQRIAAGESDVHPAVAKLLRLMIEYKIPPDRVPAA
jgi:transcriptional regulator with XRE-family HTH domain